MGQVGCIYNAAWVYIRNTVKTNFEKHIYFLRKVWYNISDNNRRQYKWVLISSEWAEHR